MKQIEVCKHCGSTAITQDACYHVNIGTYSTYDDMQCGSCGAEGYDITVTVEVPDDFDIHNGRVSV